MMHTETCNSHVKGDVIWFIKSGYIGLFSLQLFLVSMDLILG